MRAARHIILSASLLFIVAEARCSEFFNIVKVADGVYAAIGKPGVLCNAAIIVIDDGVIVVDTHLRPSWAKDVIREISKITPKPVRYVINTHWHNDHTQGNAAYLSAFPAGTEFISHHYTRDDIIDKAIPRVKQTLAELPARIEQWRSQLESGRTQAGSALTDSAKSALRQQIENQESLFEELKKLEITVPNMTFDKSLVIHSGARQVQLLYFGEGHTRGDIFVYLPKEKVLVTGDMLTGGVPFMRDAIPTAWAATLDAVGELQIETVIPGHGEVMKGKERLDLVVRYLNDLVSAVKTKVERGATLDEVTRMVTDEMAPRYEEEFPGFRQALAGPNGNVAKVYEALKR